MWALYDPFRHHADVCGNSGVKTGDTAAKHLTTRLQDSPVSIRPPRNWPSILRRPVVALRIFVHPGGRIRRRPRGACHPTGSPRRPVCDQVIGLSISLARRVISTCRSDAGARVRFTQPITQIARRKRDPMVKLVLAVAAAQIQIRISDRTRQRLRVVRRAKMSSNDNILVGLRPCRAHRRYQSQAG